MADFARFLPRLLANEGGYCHTPGDAGQETWRGVARAYHPQWPGWALVDAAKQRLGLRSPVPPASYPALNKALGADGTLAGWVKAFYKAEFWDALRLDEVRSQAVAEQLADHGVNAGPARPGRMLQFALRQLGYPAVVEDGVVGPATLRAANDCPPRLLYNALVALRRTFYRYRAAQATPPAGSPELALLARLRVRPDASQRPFLASWLARVAALPYAE
jgi:lysozyme family protein